MKKYPKRGSFQDVKLNAEAVGFQIKESYKKARTNIAYSIVKKGCKMVSITSSSKSEGKTITAVNIAIALAQQVDTRVLIIDCDLRRPRIQSVLEIPVDKGITNYLNFECEVSDIVYTSKLDNLDAICCGTIPPNPSELLSSDNMKELIKELSKQYDYIIFDTPPIGVVIDALPIIKQTDGVVVIVRDNVTDIRDYKKTIDILKRSEANIICVIFTCFNARFYHTPLAKISSVTEKETMSRKGTRDAEEYYYTQKITARILNGTHKGEEIAISNEYTSSQVQNQKYHKGDTVLLSGSRENPGKSIRSIKRDGYLALLAGGLFFLLICITGKQGFYTIISLILNTIIFAFGFQALRKGEPILNICNVIAFLFSITTLICLNGIHRKTWASVISTICVLFLIMALFEFSIQFFGDLDYSNLEYLGSMSNSADIFWTDIMLTGLGAIMDVAVTISAATGEIVRKNPDVSLRKLIHSGREIGYDIMGTMINVLLFVLASGMIPMFILKMNNEIRFITIIRYHIPYDICRFLIESIGIVLAIPVSVFISSIIMKLPSLKRSDKK